ncbi:MAG TPA: universal stress protein [Mucilaginibacter sp.]|nr:universal stress protein [Mucilaginibacter sp.]
MKISKILIGVDDSKYAEHAASYGFDIARKFEAEVGIVNIIEPAIMTGPASGIDPLSGSGIVSNAEDDIEIMDIQKQFGERIVEDTIKKFADNLQVAHFTEYGSTADGIISCAEDFGADMIVIGTHSRTGFDRLVMGSVAEHVVRHAKVPVLVVPLVKEDKK